MDGRDGGGGRGSLTPMPRAPSNSEEQQQRHKRQKQKAGSQLLRHSTHKISLFLLWFGFRLWFGRGSDTLLVCVMRLLHLSAVIDEDVSE